MISNEPRWVEVEVTGSTTGEKYYGKFCVKPYLTMAERADAEKLAGKYTLGMEESQVKNLLRFAAFTTLHITAFEAPWWTDNGLNLMDEEPVYEIGNQISKLREKLKAPKVEVKDEQNQGS